MRLMFYQIIWFGLVVSSVTQAADWSEWIEKNRKNMAVVQQRAVQKRKRLQWIGPTFGFTDRKDFYHHPFVSTGGRYHFNEHHGIEFLRLYWSFPREGDLAQQIRERTDFQPDGQASHFQLSSSYVFTPVYGKYAWGSNSLVHFDVFTTLGAGLRFVSQTQLYAVVGIGTSHYIFDKRLAVIPEVRLRLYNEARTQSTFVAEGIFQLGVSWLF